MSKDVAKYIYKLAKEDEITEKDLNRIKKLVSSFDAGHWKKIILNLIQSHNTKIPINNESMFHTVFMTNVSFDMYYTQRVDLQNHDSENELDTNIFAQVLAKSSRWVNPPWRMYGIINDPFLKRIIEEVLIPLDLRWRVVEKTRDTPTNFIISWQHWIGPQP